MYFLILPCTSLASIICTQGSWACSFKNKFPFYFFNFNFLLHRINQTYLQYTKKTSMEFHRKSITYPKNKHRWWPSIGSVSSRHEVTDFVHNRIGFQFLHRGANGSVVQHIQAVDLFGLNAWSLEEGRHIGSCRQQRHNVLNAPKEGEADQRDFCGNNQIHARPLVTRIADVEGSPDDNEASFSNCKIREFKAFKIQRERVTLAYFLQLIRSTTASYVQPSRRRPTVYIVRLLSSSSANTSNCYLEKHQLRF